MNGIFKYSITNQYTEAHEITCVDWNSSYHRWIQTLGFQTWSKYNCEYLFMATFLTNCSVVRTNGVEGRSEHDEKTRQINDIGNQKTHFYPEY